EPSSWKDGILPVAFDEKDKIIIENMKDKLITNVFDIRSETASVNIDLGTLHVEIVSPLLSSSSSSRIPHRISPILEFKYNPPESMQKLEQKGKLQKIKDFGKVVSSATV